MLLFYIRSNDRPITHNVWSFWYQIQDVGEYCNTNSDRRHTRNSGFDRGDFGDNDGRTNDTDDAGFSWIGWRHREPIEQLNLCIQKTVYVSSSADGVQAFVLQTILTSLFGCSSVSICSLVRLTVKTFPCVHLYSPTRH